MRGPERRVTGPPAVLAGGRPSELGALPGAPFRELDTESGHPLGYTSPS
jgi:hypothetical protein